MKTRTSAAIAVASMLIGMGYALAEGGITSRSPDDAYNDMMRDWGAKPSGTPKQQVMTRSEEAAHADMMRNWDAKMAGEPKKEAVSQSERDRYMELIRGTFPLSKTDPE
ncbi:MAG: hypothetical protein ACKVQA_11700 [Burkholderiales bacterium]